MSTGYAELPRGATSRLPSPEQATAELRERTAVNVYTAAVALRSSERTVREAVERGEIPSIRLGRNIVIPTAPLRRMLGIED